jgi:uroporphyrinogen-III synthase
VNGSIVNRERSIEKMQNKHILSTAALDESIADEAKAMGIYIDAIPFIETQEIENGYLRKQIEEMAKQKLAVVFTSIVAVRAVANVSAATKWKIYCVGENTEALLRKHFGECVVGSANNASELAEIIIQDKVGKVTFFCGDIRREELPVKLMDAGIELEEVVVYRTVETPQEIKKNYDGVLFFSPSGVRSYFKMNTALISTTLFAIGSTTANEIKNYSRNDVITPKKPGKVELVKLMTEYYKQQAC